MFIFISIVNIQLTNGCHPEPELVRSGRTMSDYSRCLYSRGRCHGPLKSHAYVNGKIYTVDKNDPDWISNPKEALVMEDGIIKFVGSNAQAQQFMGPETVKLDLEGSVVMPGFHDVHMHPLEVGNEAAGTCQLKRGVGPATKAMERSFGRCWSKQVGTDWVLGHGHSIQPMLDHIRNGGRDPKLILDDIMPEGIPAVMMEETSHSMWVNSKALEQAGITQDTPDKPGGIIMKNAQGQPNGVLLENAGNTIMEHALDPNAFPDLRRISHEGLQWALKRLAKNGITSVCDARTYWTREHHKAWQKVENDGELTVRAVLGLWAYPEKEDPEQIEALTKLFNNDPDRRLRLSQVKLYSDGLLETTTAATLQDYLVDYGLGFNKGINYFDKSRLTKYIRELQNVGFDFHIHAIGDRGVREALDAVEATKGEQTEPRRHRITHVELVDQADIPRFAQLGVLADAQVSSELDQESLEELIGPGRDHIPIKSLVDAGAHVTLSSDWDVSSLNPFLGIFKALKRGSQAVDVKTAVEMYTINGAYVMRQEDKTGSLVAGKEADFIVLDRDIFELGQSSSYNERRRIKRAKVLQTVLAGQEVWTSRAF